MAEKTDIVPTSDKDQEINKRWFIPVNRSNLSAFLAGGVIVPSAFLPNYERDIQCFSRNHILIIKNDHNKVDKLCCHLCLLEDCQPNLHHYV